jgi:hypothetical protein
MRVAAVVLGAMVFMGSGCEGRDVSEPDPEGTNAKVRFVNVEGGCWVLVSESGKTFEPTALPAGYQKDGLDVRFAYQARNDVGSYCMVGGEIVEITSIAPR